MPNDRTGVAMIYSSSRTNPQSWFFDQLKTDSRTDGDEFFAAPNENINNVNRTKILAKMEEVREHLLSVKSTSGYDESEIELNHVKAKAQGYSHSRNDWRDVEMTAYIKFIETNPESCFYLYARSGRHSTGKPCEGTKYALCIMPDGTIRGEKEMWHPGGYIYFPKVSILGDIEGKRIGIKFVIYNKSNDNVNVTLEAYVDINADNKWSKIYSYIDSGDDGRDEYLKCGDETTKTITWGGPIASFRCVDIPSNGIEIDHLSVREISPENTKIDRADSIHIPIPTVLPSTGTRPNLPDSWTDEDIDVVGEDE